VGGWIHQRVRGRCLRERVSYGAAGGTQAPDTWQLPLWPCIQTLHPQDSERQYPIAGSLRACRWSYGCRFPSFLAKMHEMEGGLFKGVANSRGH